MRMLTRIIILTLMVSFGYTAHAQKLTKEEKKALKAQLKKYRKNPELLRDLTEESDALREENRELQSRINQMESEKSHSSSQVAQKDRELMELNNRLLDAQEALRQKNEEPPAVMTPREVETGTHFKIQIGAYEKTYIPENLAGEDMGLESDGSLQKVLVGKFNDYQAAKELKKYIRNIGIKDAFIVAYRDGLRVDLDEVVAEEEQ
ncbi:MAG: hypothetical protein KTR30_02420 [Saprospiraceae bacterium]|nr:hypothetical protein [Saprospiraceae bacterium]